MLPYMWYQDVVCHMRNIFDYADLPCDTYSELATGSRLIGLWSGKVLYPQDISHELFQSIKFYVEGQVKDWKVNLDRYMGSILLLDHVDMPSWL